jgi:hypothetical protein
MNYREKVLRDQWLSFYSLKQTFFYGQKPIYKKKQAQAELKGGERALITLQS